WFNRDGSLLGYGRSGARVRLYRVAAGRELRILRHRLAAATEVLDSPLLDADGRILAATSPGRLHFFLFATGEELASVRLPPGIRAHPFRFKRGRGWLTGGHDQVRLWPTAIDPKDPNVVR